MVLLATLITGIGFLTWWLFIASEGVYLGRRVVIWLYDLYAHRYDDVKNYYRDYEHIYLAQPIMERLAPLKSPLVLDVATGTGRLPLALMRHTRFEGFVIGVDLSRRMLHYATRNLYPHERATFIWGPAESLPFDDNMFDLVTCLEALEFMERPEQVVKELVRVLRPGGTILITQRINTRLMPGKTWTSGKIQAVLESLGVEGGKAHIGQVDYRKVWGTKKGDSSSTGVKPLEAILRCPRCGQREMEQAEQRLVCANCGATVKIGADGVVEFAGS
jgi:ubiquinone/menaquinone biosynthesis C-methylase UbiE/ribosomal protein L37E